MQPLIRATMVTPAQGADTAVWLATDPSLEKVSGEYFIGRRKKTGSASSRDAALAEKLWQLSEAAV
jgi:hypothetical protein